MAGFARRFVFQFILKSNILRNIKSANTLKETFRYWSQHFCILADRNINEGNYQKRANIKNDILLAVGGTTMGLLSGTDVSEDDQSAEKEQHGETCLKRQWEGGL